MFRREHADLERLLDLLDWQLATFRDGGRPDYELIGTIVEYCKSYQDVVHHPREDLVFGKLLVRDRGVAATIDDLQEDHGRLAARARELAAAVRQVVAEEIVDRAWVWGLCEKLVQAYHRHIAYEEEQFFPAAEAALTGEDWAELENRFEDRGDPLFGEQVADRFRALRNDIDDLARIARQA
jgi:hemerythrin-like domain-containing protein